MLGRCCLIVLMEFESEIRALGKCRTLLSTCWVLSRPLQRLLLPARLCMGVFIILSKTWGWIDLRSRPLTIAAVAASPADAVLHPPV